MNNGFPGLLCKAANADSRLGRSRRTGAPHSQLRVTDTDLERREALKRRSTSTKQLVCLPREETPTILAVMVNVATADPIADKPKLVGPCHWQRP